MKYLNNFTKLTLIFISIIILTGCNKNNPPDNSKEPEVKEEKPIEIKLEDSISEDMKYSKVNIVYFNDETTFAFDITNTKEDAININYVFVRLLDANNNYIAENEIFVGQTINPSESYPISITVPLDFSKVAKAEYRLWDGVSPTSTDSV